MVLLRSDQQYLEATAAAAEQLAWMRRRWPRLTVAEAAAAIGDPARVWRWAQVRELYAAAYLVTEDATFRERSSGK